MPQVDKPTSPNQNYDAATNRLSTTDNGQTTLFRYDGGQNFQELDPSGHVTTEPIRAGGQGGGIGSVLYTDKSMGNPKGDIPIVAGNPTEF